MPTIIKGQPTSIEVRQRLKDHGKPVILQFSCGKDSIATWIALRDADIEVIPVFLHIVPGLSFIADEVEYFQDHFKTRIRQYLHPGLYKALSRGVAQTPERSRILESIDLPITTFDEFWDIIRDDEGLDHDTYLADGIRAADSIIRRTSFTKYGVFRQIPRKVSPICDWLKGEVLDAIAKDGIELPVDYELFGRSFDGSDYRFSHKIRDRFPDDYKKILELFPMAEADIFRNEVL